jgi:hypothetical protein
LPLLEHAGSNSVIATIITIAFFPLLLLLLLLLQAGVAAVGCEAGGARGADQGMHEEGQGVCCYLDVL